MFSHTKLLGKLAFRVFSCPVNSVASECAFSTQNLIHMVSHNSLHSERADKLVYLQINGRHVSQFDNKFDYASELKSKPLRDLTPQEEVDLETILMGEELQGNPIENSVDCEGEGNNENAENVVDVGDVSEDDEDDEF